MYLIWLIIENKIFQIGDHGRFIVAERGQKGWEPLVQNDVQHIYLCMKWCGKVGLTLVNGVLAQCLHKCGW